MDRLGLVPFFRSEGESARLSKGEVCGELEDFLTGEDSQTLWDFLCSKS